VDAPGQQGIVVAGSDEDPHGLPGGEGLGEELGGVDTGALVFEQVTTNGDGDAAALDRGLTGASQRLTQAHTAAPGEIALAAHGGERAIQVEVGDVEKA